VRDDARSTRAGDDAPDEVTTPPGVVDKVSWVGTATPLRDRSDRRGDLPV